MEGPERLVANWGAKGKMVNIADLFDATDKAEINAAALAACFANDTTAYEYPLVMTAHCMAINKTVFTAAGAMQYIPSPALCVTRPLRSALPPCSRERIKPMEQSMK